MTYDELEKRVHWGPTLVCPRCSNKEWIKLDRGVVCGDCYEGIEIFLRYDPAIENERNKIFKAENRTIMGLAKAYRITIEEDKYPCTTLSRLLRALMEKKEKNHDTRSD